MIAHLIQIHSEILKHFIYFILTSMQITTFIDLNFFRFSCMDYCKVLAFILFPIDDSSDSSRRIVRLHKVRLGFEPCREERLVEPTTSVDLCELTMLGASTIPHWLRLLLWGVKLGIFWHEVGVASFSHSSLIVGLEAAIYPKRRLSAVIPRSDRRSERP